MKRTLILIMVCGIICWMWLGLICLRVIPFDMISLYCATILASGITYSSGPIFFEFTVELVYPVPEGVVGGFLTVVYNTTGMIFLFLFYIPVLRKYYVSIWLFELEGANMSINKFEVFTHWLIIKKICCSLSETSPHWIPYAFMISTCISLPLLLLVKEEYRRSNLDTSWNDEPRQEASSDESVTNLVTMYDSCN